MSVIICGPIYNPKELYEALESKDIRSGDTIISLGNSHINYLGPKDDFERKKLFSAVPLRLIFLRGPDDLPPDIDHVHRVFLNDKDIEGDLFGDNDFGNLYYTDEVCEIRINGVKSFIFCGGEDYHRGSKQRMTDLGHKGYPVRKAPHLNPENQAAGRKLVDDWLNETDEKICNCLSSSIPTDGIHILYPDKLIDQNFYKTAVYLNPIWRKLREKKRVSWYGMYDRERCLMSGKYDIMLSKGKTWKLTGEKIL